MQNQVKAETHAGVQILTCCVPMSYTRHDPHKKNPGKRHGLALYNKLYSTDESRLGCVRCAAVVYVCREAPQGMSSASLLNLRGETSALPVEGCQQAAYHATSSPRRALSSATSYHGSSRAEQALLVLRAQAVSLPASFTSFIPIRSYPRLLLGLNSLVRGSLCDSQLGRSSGPIPPGRVAARH